MLKRCWSAPLYFVLITVIVQAQSPQTTPLPTSWERRAGPGYLPSAQGAVAPKDICKSLVQSIQ